MLPAPTIQTIAPRKLVGLSKTMTLMNNTTGELWRTFMISKNQIKNQVGNKLYSLQNYSPSYFQNFSLANEFQKWAAMEVSSFDDIPEGLKGFELTGGMYAVFNYRGPASEGARVFQYIFNTWLPQSGYALDNRPHFELLGEKYKNNDPSSEEEIWIPVTPK